MSDRPAFDPAIFNPSIFGCGLASPVYPDAPGHRGVETSIAAAKTVAPKLGRLQRLALEAVKSRGAVGLTTDELAEALNLDRPSIQPRTSELSRKGLIVDSGLRRHNASRRRAIVWIVPQAAEQMGAGHEAE
jgi:DNA-binding MarR family transcriptional regulator